MSWATDAPGRLATPAGAGARLAGLILLLAAPLSPAVLPAEAATPAELRSIMEKADRALSQAEKAAGGRDPGRVSLHLMRLDEQIGAFLEAGRLEELAGAFERARAAVREDDMPAAATAIGRATRLMDGLADYVVLRQAAEASRGAIRAAEARDGEGCLRALDRLEGAVLAPVLLARLREAREAVSRARQAMVRNDMQGGREHLRAARRALGGLEYAGALSRASFSLAMGGEFLASDSAITARDQIQKALRDLRTAAESGPEASRPALEEARARTVEIWKRLGRPRDGDAAAIAEIARTVEAIRMRQR